MTATQYRLARHRLARALGDGDWSASSDARTAAFWAVRAFECASTDDERAEVRALVDLGYGEG